MIKNESALNIDLGCEESTAYPSLLLSGNLSVTELTIAVPAILARLI